MWGESLRNHRTVIFVFVRGCRLSALTDTLFAADFHLFTVEVSGPLNAAWSLTVRWAQGNCPLIVGDFHRATAHSQPHHRHRGALPSPHMRSLGPDGAETPGLLAFKDICILNPPVGGAGHRGAVSDDMSETREHSGYLLLRGQRQQQAASTAGTHRSNRAARRFLFSV